MKTLKFVYRMKLHFSNPVWNHYFALRCLPTDQDMQRITITRCHVTPSDCLNEVTDGFGNFRHVGHCMAYHDSFSYEVEGIARVEGMHVHKGELHPMYRYPSRYTGCGEALREFADKADPKCGTNLERARIIMDYLYRHFTYQKGVTGIDTTAEEAFSLGAGVCQDYAHIMIAILKYVGIPARYVNGLMIGEGYTHAWIEIYTGEGWYGLDPTNNLHVDDYYIKLAHGRDYADCVLDQGCFFGNASQQLEVYVNVEEMK